MKKSPRTAQKLALRKDTLRVLDKLDLSEIAAGVQASTLLLGCPRSVLVHCNTTIVN